MKIKIMIVLLLLSGVIHAQETTPKELTSASHRWYGGIQGGVPFGFSTFNSFGADKTRAGWSAGLFGGYKFNPVLSAELSVAFGKVGMSADEDCCVYWLGADWQHHLASVAGSQSYAYSNLYSKVSTQRYGLQLNVDVLQLIRRDEFRRWSVKVAPMVAAVSTKSTLKTIDTDAEIRKCDGQFHIGLGGQVAAGYRISEHITADVYSMLLTLSGDKMDGMPEHLHNQNMIWETGVKVGWIFGKGASKPTEPAPVEELPTEPVDTVVPEVAAVEEPAPVDTMVVEPVQPVLVIEEPVEEEEPAQILKDTLVTLPTIYFSYDGISISPSEKEKMNAMIKQMKEHPNMVLEITGWGDKRGSKEANMRVSYKRACSVRNYLVANGIESQRITVKGNGIDYNTTDDAKARRTDTNGKENTL